MVPVKPKPVIATLVPTGPWVGVKVILAGGKVVVVLVVVVVVVVALTVKLAAEVAVPLGVSTEIGPVVAPAGTVALI